ncbi:hypothetical protein [Fulvivirga sediminis]|uniref:Uncharacterized protein n=1 Tax=Fulvivirga sediminis TaxID=2803949 RepID=A0A937F392_9BACT|nr:hypothetical protein [Fulvivirga sediminis]MBL3654890.1 hypothetical protein [Fulvivirga sediminis]
MLSYFRINDPYRLVIIFFLLLALRLPVILSDSGLTAPELSHMLVGEKLNNGASLYEGLWDNIAPLSALVYAIIDFLFGRSQQAYQYISLFLVAFQCLIFNKMLLDSKAYNENNYVPGLVYGLLMSFFFDFFTLTPVLMGLTFLLLALDNLFDHIEYRAKEDEKILNIGIYLGLASLFYLPYIIFGIAVILCFMLFTGTVARRYLLMIFGLMLPLLLTSGYFLLQHRLTVFIYNYLNPIWQFQTDNYVSLLEILIIFSVPLAFFLFSLFRISQRARFNNYQGRLAQVMFLWLIFSVLFTLISGELAPNIMMIFVPFLSFFIVHAFLLFYRRWVAEIVFTLFVVATVFFSLGAYFDFFFTSKYMLNDKYMVDYTAGKKWEGKRILVLDKNIASYRNAIPATPFLNWELVEGLFRNPEYYDNLTIIQQGFSEDIPEVIIDKHAVMPAVFDKLPEMKMRYRKEGEVYYLKS